jgi:hypothetical protein
VASVTAGAAADRAGIKRDDVITKFNGKTVKDNRGLVDMVMRTAPGTTVPVEIYRSKKAMTLNVKVDELNLAQEQEQTPAAQQRHAAGRSAQPAQRAASTAFGMPATSRRPSRDLGLPANARASSARSNRRQRSAPAADGRRDRRDRRQPGHERRSGERDSTRSRGPVGARHPCATDKRASRS